MTAPSNEKAVVENHTSTPAADALPVSGGIDTTVLIAAAIGKRLAGFDPDCHPNQNLLSEAQRSIAALTSIIAAIRSHPQAPASGEGWITIIADRALYLDDGKTKILCDRLPSPVTLVLKLSPSQPASGEADPIHSLAESIQEQIKERGGFWRTCTGCYESEDGHPNGHYPHSNAFGCTLGAGCSECGGIGATWDTTDYADMADFMLKREAERKCQHCGASESDWTKEGLRSPVVKVSSNEEVIVENPSPAPTQGDRG